MIGIILWAIMILVIIAYACPGFISALLVCMAIVGTLYGLIIYLYTKYCKTV